MDYEKLILERQESESDDCKNCPYKENCKNQCERITEKYFNWEVLRYE